MLRVQSRSSKNLDPTLNTSLKIFCGIFLRSSFNEHKPYLNGFLRFKSFFFALHVGTWDPL